MSEEQVGYDPQPDEPKPEVNPFTAAAPADPVVDNALPSQDAMTEPTESNVPQSPFATPEVDAEGNIHQKP